MEKTTEPVGARDLGPGESSVALCYSACTRSGGVERVVYEASRHLRKNWRVSVCAHRFPGVVEMPDAVEPLRLGGMELPLGMGLRSTRTKTEKIVRRRKFDVVAGFGVQAPEDSVVWVQSVHAAWWELSRRRRRGWLLARQLANPFHRVVLRMESELYRGRRYRRLIALTPQVQRDLETHYGVPSRDVDVVPNGYHPNEFNAGLADEYREVMRRVLGVPLDAWVVLFVANEWERKGLFPLMEAVRALGSSQVWLVAVGRLPQGRVMEKARELGIERRVCCVGSSADVRRYFAMADVFALPTVYEAWGMVVIEALASGVPVLTSKTAGAASAVHEGWNGFLLDHPSDAEEVAQGLERLRRGLHGSPAQIATSVEAYEWPRLFSRYEDILKRCI